MIISGGIWISDEDGEADDYRPLDLGFDPDCECGHAEQLWHDGGGCLQCDCRRPRRTRGCVKGMGHMHRNCHSYGLCRSRHRREVAP